MAQRNNAGLNGLEPLAYMGVNATQPPQFEQFNRPPTSNDYATFTIGDEWLDTSVNPRRVFKLVAKTATSGTWQLLTGGTGTVTSLTGNDGNPAVPLMGNINVRGDGGIINITRSPDNNSLLVEAQGNVATLYPTNSGNAVPVLNVLNVLGAHNVDTSAIANTITVSGTNTITIGDLADVSGTAAQTVTTGDIVLAASNQSAATNQMIRFTTNTGVDGNISMFLGNVFIGQRSGNTTMTGLFNVGIGADTLRNVTTGERNFAVGHAALENITTGNQNTAMGYTAGQAITTGSENICIGHEAGLDITTGSGNVVISSSPIAGITGADSNNILIDNSGIAGLSNYVAIGGNNAPRVFHNFGTDCIFGGDNSGNTTHTAVGCSAFGVDALQNLTTGQGNSAFGHRSLETVTTGQDNMAIGSASMILLTTGSFNTAVGSVSAQAMTTATYNTALGYGALDNLVSGEYNTVVGWDAGGNFTTNDSNNICINNSGTAGDNNTLRIGTATGTGVRNLNRTFIHGIRGITTGVNDAIAVLVDSAGQLGTVSSSARYKDNIADIGQKSAILHDLRPRQFTYKQDETHRINFGLVAEEVEQVCPHLVVYKDGQPETVRYHELVPLLLNELIALKKEVVTLKQRLL